MKSYKLYKDSGVEWIGEIPDHWSIQRLKNVSAIIPSNVDKKSKEGENPVQLCNYVDVYKNDFISDDLDFMVATAANHQIDKLSLLEKDVIATKDSEDPKDIGVPALVLKDMVGVVCGYHLTLIRAFQDKLDGAYLYWFVRSDRTSQYFYVNARGITRYAIGSNVFKNLRIGLPPLEEQNAIAIYLNQKTNEINELISKKERLIILLEEEKTAVINQAVTKGLNPDVPMKDSGVEWLGNIPKHWELKKLKFLIKTIKGYAFKSELFTDNGVPIVKASDIKNKTVRKQITSYIRAEHSWKYSSVKLTKGDILISTVGSNPEVKNSAVGQIGKVPDSLDGALLNQNTVKMEVNSSDLFQDFLFYLIQNHSYRKYLDLYAHGTANQASLKLVDILDYSIGLPPIKEQISIVQNIQGKLKNIEDLLKRIVMEISLLKEYKTALINEVVTGKVDVREEMLVN